MVSRGQAVVSRAENDALGNAMGGELHMRRIVTALLTTVVVLLGGAGAAGAAVGPADRADTPPPIGLGGWEPDPAGPVDVAAGRFCDFALHLDPTVNEVRVKVVQTYPDGSPKQALADGDLIYQVTNVDTGQSVTADASGRAVFEFGTDGSVLWRVVGPIIAGLAEGSSNLPRGLYTIDGVYTVAFSPTGFKTITLTHGTVHNICDDLD
jgi:hypothetical protein